MEQVAQKIDWIYNKDNGNIYKDKETLQRHNNYLKFKESDNKNNREQPDFSLLVRKSLEKGNF